MFKFGVNNVLACWICNLGVSTRSLAIQLSDLYANESDNVGFSDIARWFVNLSNEYILNELDGRAFDLQQILKIRNRVTVGKSFLESIRNPLQSLESPVRGIPYENRADLASQVSEGEKLFLEPEIDNLHDPYAVQVLFNEEKIGYVQRDVARIISRELLLGRGVQANVTNVRRATETYPYPWIEMEIIFQ